MRLATIAFVWFLGAAASAAAGEPAPAFVSQNLVSPTLAAPTPAPNAPPYPGTTSPAPPVFPGAPSNPPSVPQNVRAYAPAPSPTAVATPTGSTQAGKVRAEPARTAHGRVCFGQAETRDKIAQLHLADPVSATRAGREEGEVLRTRLCHGKGDELVYVIYVLPRDGHVMRLYRNAQNGNAVSAADAAEHR